MYVALLLCMMVMDSRPASGVAVVNVGIREAVAHPSMTGGNFARLSARARRVAAQNRNAITGFVFDSLRRPVGNLRVELMDDYYANMGNTRTNSSGQYGFYNLSPGTYQIKVLPDGTNFIGQTQRVTITNFSMGRGGRLSGSQFEQVDFTLKTRDEVASTNRPTTTATTFAQQVPQPAREAYEKGVESLDQKNNAEQGITELKKAIELFPTYYMALERLGGEYVKRRQYDPAVAVLKKAIEVNPRGASSLYALGVAQYYLKLTSEAIDSLRHSLSLSPDSPNVAFLHMYLGMALLKGGNRDEAETHLKQAHERGGKLVPDVHMHLAQIYSDRKRYKEAADELDIFLKEMPDARDAATIKNIIKQLREKASQ